MSGEIFYQSYTRKLPVKSAVEKMVFMRLCWYASDQGRDIYPAVRTLAHHCSCSENTIRSAIKKLIERGLVKLVKEGGNIPDIGRQANEYAIDLDALYNLPPIGEPDRPKKARATDPRQMEMFEEVEGKVREEMTNLVVEGSTSDGSFTMPPNTDKTPKALDNKTMKTETPEFKEFYDSAFPRKEGRGDARKAWNKTLKDGADAKQLIAAARNYAVKMVEEGREERHIKHPSSWLNGEHWRKYMGEETTPTTFTPIALGNKNLDDDWAEMCDHLIGGDEKIQVWLEQTGAKAAVGNTLLLLCRSKLAADNLQRKFSDRIRAEAKVVIGQSIDTIETEVADVFSQ